jgi:hypothetical protein
MAIRTSATEGKMTASDTITDVNGSRDASNTSLPSTEGKKLISVTPTAAGAFAGDERTIVLLKNVYKKEEKKKTRIWSIYICPMVIGISVV